jgi:uncharacterized protein YfaS (alpha-2-macroglobulin family)
VDTKDAFGLIPVNVKVSYANDSFTRDYAVSVQAATPYQNLKSFFEIKPGQSVLVRDEDKKELMPTTLAGHITVSSEPPLDIRNAIHGLLMYPYGCAEQTTSSAYPHVFIDEEEARRYDLKAFGYDERRRMLAGAFARLAGYQSANGGFSIWGNVSNYEYWLSAYITNFLIDAKENGFDVPTAMKDRATDFLLKGLQDGIIGLGNNPRGNLWNDYYYGGNGRFGALAYGAYVLARENKAPLSTLRSLYDKRENAHSGLGLVQLGIALHLMGDQKRGQELLDSAIATTRKSTAWWGDYGSDLRDSALMLSLLQRHKMTAKNQGSLYALIDSELKRNRYTSTQEKLAVFLAGRNIEDGDQTSPWQVTLDGKALSALRPQTLGWSDAQLNDGVTVQNTGDKNVYVHLGITGNSVEMPKADDEHFRLTRTFYDVNGKEVPPGRKFKVGDNLFVLLEVKTSGRIQNALVVDKVPAGFEIENLNFAHGEGLGVISVGGFSPAAIMSNPNIDHTEYRDDRFVVAARLNGRWDVTRFIYRIKAVTPGTFLHPPLFAEDMYRPGVNGQVGGEEVVSINN